MDPTSALVGILSGLVVGGALTVIRNIVARREKDEERAIAAASFQGAVKAELEGVHTRLDKIDQRILGLPCMSCERKAAG